MAEDSSSKSSPSSAETKKLPELNNSTLPDIKSTNLPGSSAYNQLKPEAPSYNPSTSYSKEQVEALNKSRNWAVEGLKDRREVDRLETEKLEKTETSSVDDLLEKERKSIDDRMGKPSSLNSLKPSIETNWDTIKSTGGVSASEKELAENKEALQALNRMTNSLGADPTNGNLGEGMNTKESLQAFDSPNSSPGNELNRGTGAFSRNGEMKSQNNLESLQNQMDGIKAKNDSNFDYLVSTGQAQNFRKLSNDPNFEPTPSVSLPGQPSIDAVPSVPKPVNSNMTVETLRQIEQQRANAIPKPDYKDLNSRIPSPGTRRF